MSMINNVDQLIASLKKFKTSVPNLENSYDLTSFNDFFENSINELERANTVASETIVEEDLSANTTVSAPATEAEKEVEVETTEVLPELSHFEKFKAMNLITTAEKSRAAKPHDLPEFMSKTGATFQDATGLLYGVIGANTDLRDWEQIMSSNDPLSAARAATYQLYNSDADYQLGQHPDKDTGNYSATLRAHSLDSQTVVQKAGNFADVGFLEISRHGGDKHGFDFVGWNYKRKLKGLRGFLALTFQNTY